MKVYLAPISGPNLQKEISAMRAYLDSKYEVMENGNVWQGVLRSDSIIIYNLSFQNFLISILGRIFYKRIVYFCHEPKKSCSDLRDSSVKNVAKGLMLNILQPIIFFCSSKIVTFSSVGYRKVGLLWQDKCIESRLLLDPIEFIRVNRIYDIAWIGKTSKEKGFDKYVEVLENNPTLNGVVCTSDSSNQVMSKFKLNAPVYFEYSNTNSARDVLCKSKCVAIMHRSLTQSGVAVEALRSGVYLLSDNENLIEMYREFDVVINIDELSSKILNGYFEACIPERVFNDMHHSRFYSRLFDDLNFEK